MSAASALSDPPSSPSAPTDGATSDSGLAEWASRIKEMQRQVDADEDTEQRRLEEEIVRTRLARQRRLRTGQSGDFGIGMKGIDLKSPTGAVRPTESDEPINSTREKPTPPVTFPKPIAKVTTASSVKRAPISLAEFMGGSASGPRLKRHEPQIDASRAYDGRMDHGPVHPIFGRGGVAMPGMVGQRGESASARTTATIATAPSPTDSPVLSNGPLATNQPRPRTTSTLAAALRYVEKLNEQAPPRAQTPRLSGLGIRERRMSTPGCSSSSENQVNASATTFSPRSENFTEKTIIPDIMANPPATHSATDPPKVFVSQATEPSSKTFISDVRSRQPISEARNKALPDGARAGALMQSVPGTSINPPPSTPSTSPRVLPGPFASSDRMTPDSQSERGSASAFLRPRTNSAKDPTPSISRLQGRGFVQSVVRASEAGSQARPVSVKNVLSSPSQFSVEGDLREKFTRRASVLDRWQPGMNTAPPSPSHRMSSPTRSQIGDLRQGQDNSKIVTHDTGRSIRSAVSMSAIPMMAVNKSDAMSEQGVDKKLGSASTKITLIKPARTGDSPPVPVVNELGIKKGGLTMTEVVTKDIKERERTIPSIPRLGMSGSPSSGKPLSHPTKDRAKKPRKMARFEEIKASEPGRCEVSPAGSSALGVHSTKSSSLSATETRFPTSDTQHRRNPVGPAVASHPEFALEAKVSPPNASGRIAGLTPTMLLQGGQGDSSGTTTKDKEGHTVPTTPVRKPRIPSTGNRARVMDVAQVMNGARQSSLPICLRQGPPTSLSSDSGLDSILAPSVERRKSNYESRPELATPAVKDETALLSTPIDTLSRTAEINDDVKEGLTELVTKPLERATATTGESEVVRIDHVDEPLPRMDVKALLEANTSLPFVPSPDLTTISVEVMSVLHENATLVPCDTSILYDTELLVIVYRARSHKSGLATTKVWCWQGRKSHCGIREEGKVGELARRYGTSPEYVHQQSEPPELIHALGGRLAIRQGSRAHWSSENTTMHVIRSNSNQILIDELDLRIRNLCSGYSYCITIMDNVYVWYGIGSVSAERSAALEYAKSLATRATTIIELTEGVNDGDDDMFWMIMGDPESYARADYWRWRQNSTPSEPRCWLVELSNADAPVRPVSVLSAGIILQESVYVIDCCWEFFVLVGKRARGKRADITLAVNTAMVMSKLDTESKPFLPTVHVLILPTQLPLDMRLAFRNLDELVLNDGLIPDHMNILSVKEAVEHLQTLEWEKSALRDRTMLPLGLDTSDIPLS